MNDLTSAVVKAFESSGPIDHDELMRWLGSVDLSARGAAFAYLERADRVDRVFPRITQDEFDDQYLNYLKHCLLAGVEDSDWVHSRYEAAWALASWFKSAIAQEGKQRRMVELREWLGVTYKSEPTLRGVLVNGFLEHVVGQPVAEKLFSVWKDDSTLGVALQSAKQWQEGGGNSPID